MKARIWSYQQLPLNLQRCFAICCLFSKGKRLKRDLLINLWMAEGFITPIDKHDRLEDTGENYLDELVSRFFIEKVGVGKQKRYQLHDLLHDLAERVQGDDFIRIDSTNSRDVSSHISNMLSRSENIRHILLPSSMISELKEKICLMKNIRTFWVKHVGDIVPINVLQAILKHLEKLRVLYLFVCVDDLPDSIGKLKHLRYLSINGYQPLKKIPDSIRKLYHLQKLDLINCESLPKDFCELISLRRFVACRKTISHISHVGRLTSLQGLDHFIVRKECGYELQQLENLNQLRGEMYIAGLENVGSTEDAVKAHMQNKKYLEALTFEWNSNERDTDDVAGLCTQHVELLEALQPQHNISDLTLKGFGGDKFPNWMLSKNSLNHLTSLALMCCDKIEKISSIEESLPNCKSLILQRLNNLKEIPSLPPNLTYLEIDDLPQLSYFSEDDLLMNNERFLEVMKQIKDTRLNQYILIFLHPLILIHQARIYSKKEEGKLVLPSSITILKISSCKIASDALSICIQSLVSLSKLELSKIQILTSLPPKEVLCSLKNLKSLIIRHCYFLGSLGGIGALTSLIELKLNGCIMLNISNDSLPSSLERLEFQDCSNMGVLHVGDLSCLKSLDIVGWNGNLEGFNSLTALNSLFVKNCPEINLSSPLAKYASALPVVAVDNLLVLKLILSNETISSLEILVIRCLEGDSLDDEVLQSLTSLKCLYFSNCSFTHLQKNLKNLASLEYMILGNCPNLCEFELEELPKNLRELQIENCPNLTEKVNKGGPYRVRFRKEKTIVTFPTEEEGYRF
ncbi:putative disease resistance protein At3g14460 isoform X2 [Carex rostrata]